MNSREPFTEYHYVIESYEKIQRLYDKSLRERDYYLGDREAPRLLAEAAQEVCKTLKRLEAEHPFSFIEKIDQLSLELSEHKESIKETLSDFGKFLELEYRVLQDAELSPEVASRLLADVSRSIKFVEDLPDVQHICNLRERIADSRDLACKEAGRLRKECEPRKTIAVFFGALRPVGIGMSIIGGFAVVTANATSCLLAGTDFLPSAITGFGFISSGIAAIDPGCNKK